MIEHNDLIRQFISFKMAFKVILDHILCDFICIPDVTDINCKNKKICRWVEEESVFKVAVPEVEKKFAKLIRHHIFGISVETETHIISRNLN